MWAEVEPAMNLSVRDLCWRPYPGHPHGCPNYGRRPTCPPQAPIFWSVLDRRAPVWAIWTTFDLGAHVERMRARHPGWSWRQLVNCLYWQGGARAALRRECERFLQRVPTADWIVWTPEACGIDVTATMARVGEVLEWPPRTVTYQVALGGRVLCSLSRTSNGQQR